MELFRKRWKKNKRTVNVKRLQQSQKVSVWKISAKLRYGQINSEFEKQQITELFPAATRKFLYFVTTAAGSHFTPAYMTRTKESGVNFEHRASLKPSRLSAPQRDTHEKHTAARLLRDMTPKIMNAGRQTHIWIRNYTGVRFLAETDGLHL